MDQSPSVLSIPDYIVFALVLVISSAVGLYYGCTGGQQKTSAEFLMGNRQMAVLPVAFSIMASFQSAIMILGTPAEMYQFGTQYWLIVVGMLTTTTVVSQAMLPVYHGLKLTSSYEYLHLRFHSLNRTLGSCAFIFQTTIYMGLAMYAPSLAMEAVTGLSWKVSVMAMAVVCTFYTTLGGMKAVVWTDLIQVLIMLGGIAAICIRGLLAVGGWSIVWQRMIEGKRVEFANFSPDPYERNTIWSVIIGGAFTWLPTYGTNQALVQRYCCTSTKRKAQLALWIGFPLTIGVISMCCVCGCIIYAFYEGCDPLLANRIAKSDQLMPLFVMDTMGTLYGFPGLFIASIYSAALSTVSSGLNSLSAVTLEDIIKPYCGCCFPRTKLSPEREARISKALAFGYGIATLGIAFGASLMGDTLQAALNLFGIIGGPILGIYLLGLFFPCGNWKGAIAGHVLSTMFCIWIGMGAMVYKFPVPKAPVTLDQCLAKNLSVPNVTSITAAAISSVGLPSNITSTFDYDGLGIYRVSYLWTGFIGTSLALVIGLLVSFVTGKAKQSRI